MASPAGLTPAQAETLEQIRLPEDQRPTYRSTLRMDLRHRLEGELVDAADRLDRPMWVSKRALQSVHGCEAQHLAEQSTPFEYSIPTARGQVFHKAIELSVHLANRRAPLELVDEAIASIIAAGTTLSDFLATVGDVGLAELRGEVGGLVTTFLETFPPLRMAWRPTTEARRRAGLCSEQFMLFGRFDLTLGAPSDTTAGRVVIELKTGSTAMGHRDDLRFYALLETLVTGVPPLQMATFYVDAGRIEVEPVTEDLLEAAVRRTIGGVQRLVALEQREAEPKRLAGPPCRWCVLQTSCDTGQRWLEEDI